MATPFSFDEPQDWSQTDINDYVPPVVEPIHQRNYDPGVEAAIQGRDQQNVADQVQAQLGMKQKLNSIKAKDLVSRGIPIFKDQSGQVQAVTDDTGEPLTQYNETAKLAFTRAGNPRALKFDPYNPGVAPEQSDPYENAPEQIDPKTGDKYQIVKGMPWKWTGQDEETTTQLWQKDADANDKEMAVALGGPIAALKAQRAQAARLERLSYKELENTFARSGVQTTDEDVNPIKFNEFDPKDLHDHIDSGFKTQLDAPEANAKGWFGSGSLTPKAQELRDQIAKSQAATHAVADQYLSHRDAVSGIDASLDQLNTQREMLQAGRIQSVNAKREALGLAPVTIPGQEQPDAQPVAQKLYSVDDQGNPVLPQLGNGHAAAVAQLLQDKNVPQETAAPILAKATQQEQAFTDAKAGKKAYQIDDNGKLILDTDKPLQALIAARNDGFVPPEAAAKAAPEFKKLQDVKQQLQESLNNAGMFPQLKALVNGISTGFAQSAGASLAEAGASPLAAAAGVPTAGAGAVAVEVTAGLAGMTAAGAAKEAVMNNLANYSDTVKSLQESSKLHPNFDFAGNIIGFTLGGPQNWLLKLGSKGVGAVAEKAGVKAVTKTVGEGIAGIAGEGENAAQVFARTLGNDMASGDAAKMVAERLASGNSGLSGSIKNYQGLAKAAAEEAKAAGTSQTAAQISAVGKQVGKSALIGAAFETIARPVFDVARNAAADVLGIEHEPSAPPTLSSVFTTAALGAILGGHGIRDNTSYTDANADLLRRGMAKINAGVPLTQDSEFAQTKGAKGIVEQDGVELGKSKEAQNPGFTPSEVDRFNWINEQFGKIKDSGKQIIADPKQFRVTIHQVMTAPDRPLDPITAEKYYREQEAKWTPEQRRVVDSMRDNLGVNQLDFSAAMEASAKALGMDATGVKQIFNEATKPQKYSKAYTYGTIEGVGDKPDSGAPKLNPPTSPATVQPIETKPEAPVTPPAEQPPVAQIPAKEAAVAVPAAEEAQTPATLSEPIAGALAGDNVRHDMSDANTHYFTDLKTGLPFTVPASEPQRAYRLALAKVRTAAKQSATPTSDEQVTTPATGGEAPAPEAPATDATGAETGAPGEAPVKGDGSVAPYSKGSTQITLSKKDAAPIQEFAKSIPESDLYHGEEGSDSYGSDGYGIETEPHVTALYGLTGGGDTREAVSGAVKAHGPIKATLGKLSLFSDPSKPYDVLKADVHSPDLHAVNKSLRSLEHKSDYPDYHPHMTIAYVKKGAGDKYVGDTRFEGKQITVPALTHSSAAREKKLIPLNAKPASEPPSQTATTPHPTGTAATRAAAPQTPLPRLHGGKVNISELFNSQLETLAKVAGYADSRSQRLDLESKRSALVASLQDLESKGLIDAATILGGTPTLAAPAPAVAETAPEAIRKGEVGGQLAAGEVVSTTSGRNTTPFPKLSFDSNRKAQNTVAKVDEWLRLNAIQEANARGDDFNKRQFAASNPKKLTPAEKDSMEEYLFGQQPAVPKPFLKPLATPAPSPKPAAKETKASPDTREGRQALSEKWLNGLDSMEAIDKLQEYGINTKPLEKIAQKAREDVGGESGKDWSEDFYIEMGDILSKWENAAGKPEAAKPQPAPAPQPAPKPQQQPAAIQGAVDLGDLGATFDDALDSLNDTLGASSPIQSDKIEHKRLPKGRTLAFVNMAEALIEKGVTTPQALAATIEARKGSGFRQYVRAIWDAMKAGSETLPREEPEWKDIYAAIDKQKEAPVAEKQEDNRRMGISVGLEETQEVNGVRFEHFVGAHEAVIEQTDIDSGNVIGLKKYPTLYAGAKAFREIVEEAKRRDTPATTRKSTGNTWNSDTPTIGSTATGTYALHDASNLVTSEKPDYDQSLQPRDRSRQASKDQIAKLAMEWQPQRAGESLTTDLGSPIIDSRNHVLSGNGRTMARRILSDSKEADYRHWLKENAEKFGIDPAEIASMKQPMLVRVVQDFGGITPQAFAEDSNKHQVLGMSDAEKATSDARMLAANPSLMDSFRPSEEGNVLAASNRDFLSAFIQGTGATAELTTSEGYNVKALTLRVKNAVMAALIGPENRDLISNLTERAEELGVARVSAGILNIAPMLAKLQGTPHDLSPTLAKALIDLVRIRSNNEKIGDFLSQQGLFGDPDRTAESDYLLAKLAEAKSAKAVSEPLQRYAKLASGQDTTTEDIFGNGISTPIELLKAAYEKSGTDENQTDFSFGKPPAVVEKAKSETQNDGGGVSGKTTSPQVTPKAGDTNDPSSGTNLEPNSGNAKPPKPDGKGGVSTQPGSTDSNGNGLAGQNGEIGNPAESGPLSAAVPSAPHGTSGNQSVREPEPGASERAPGDIKPTGSGGVDESGVSPETRGSNDVAAPLIVPSGNGVLVAGGETSGEGWHPCLTPDQVSDGKFIERRLVEQKKPGVLLTNGTGTGKTFSGLGAVKRMLENGAKHIIVLAPSDKVGSDWVFTAKEFFGISDIGQLTGITDNGAGNRVVVTTYANFGQNNNLVHRQWDAVVTDESQYLSSNKDGNETEALRTLRALTWHRNGVTRRVNMMVPDAVKALAEFRKVELKNKGLNDMQRQQVARLQAVVDAATESVKKQLAATKEGDRPKVIMLSATPFAYHFSLDYAEGYLFDYPPENQRTVGRYNHPPPRSQFYIDNFGYRMRTGSLTQPENAVATGILERRFAEKLMREGAMSGRALIVPHDYSRDFVHTESALGAKIDEIMDVLNSTERFRLLSKYIGIHEYLPRRLLLESLKARDAIPRIKKHLALGRKVIVFHDYKIGGSANPLRPMFDPNMSVMYQGSDKKQHTARLSDVFEELKDAVPGYEETMRMLDHLKSPIQALTEAFPDIGIYNGSVPKNQRRAVVKAFNTSGGKMNVFLGQRASSKEGISLHDVDKKHQRVFIDLGIPGRPTDAIQGEGRPYRFGVMSNAIFEYLTTGTNFERWTFAQTIAQRASTAENLAMGERARALLQSYASGYNDASPLEPGPQQGTGGKELDRARENGNPYQNAVALYYTNQKKTSRNKSSEGLDYYATPEPLGFKMVEWAGIRPGEKVLEPSAGHGAIARFFPDATNRHAIEPINELAGRLALNATDAEIHNQRFEDYHTINKFDAIVMNPPFGTAGKTAMEHVIKAVQHLREGGRIVALIPMGGSIEKRFSAWYESDESKGIHFRAEILLPSSTFERAGTGSMTRVVVLDKVNQMTAKEEANGWFTVRNADGTRAMPGDFATRDQANLAIAREPGQKSILEMQQQTTRDLTGESETKDLFARLENMSVPERIEAQEPAPEQEHPLSSRDSVLPEGTTTAIDKAPPGGWTEKDRVPNAERKPWNQIPTPANDSTFAPADFMHTRDNVPVFVAKIERRLTKEEYAAEKARATKLGGHYSSFKGSGAIPGFHFNTSEARDNFIGGGTVANASSPLYKPTQQEQSTPNEKQETRKADANSGIEAQGRGIEKEQRPVSQDVSGARPTRPAGKRAHAKEVIARAFAEHPDLERMEAAGVYLEEAEMTGGGIGVHMETLAIRADYGKLESNAAKLDEMGYDGQAWLRAALDEEMAHIADALVSGSNAKQQHLRIYGAMTKAARVAMAKVYGIAGNESTWSIADKRDIGAEYAARQLIHSNGRMLAEDASGKDTAALKAAMDAPQSSVIEAHVDAMNSVTATGDGPQGGNGGNRPPSNRTATAAQPEDDGGMQMAGNPVSKFVNDDINPFLDRFKIGIPEAMAGIKHVLLPTKDVPTGTLDEIMKMKGAQDKAEFLVERAMQAYVKAFNKAGKQAGIDFADRYKTGQSQPTPELQQFADTIREIDTATWNEANKEDISPAWKENHLRVMWKIVPGSTQAMENIVGKFEALSKVDQAAFDTAFQAGTPQPNKEMQDIADMMNNTGTFPTWVKGAPTRTPTIPPGQGHRLLQGGKGMLKEATLPDMSAGVMRGGEPFTYNPAVGFKMAQLDLQKLLTVRRMIAGMKASKVMVYVKGAFPKLPDGKEWVQDSVTASYFPAKSGEGLVNAGRWAVETGAARLLNNHISRDYIRSSAMGRGLMFIKNTTTAMELSFSPFHAVAETLEVGASSIGLGLQKIVNGGIKGDTARVADGVKDLVSGLLLGLPASVDRRKIGEQMIQYLTQKDFVNTPEGKAFIKAFPNAATLMEDLFPAGAKLATNQDWKVGAAQTFMDALQQNNYIGAALRAVPALSESLMKPLFDHYIPRLKLGTWLKEYSNALVENEAALRKGTMTRGELARKTWQSVENRLGEMNFDNIFWNRTFKSGMQLMFRSVTWKAGSLAQYWNAFAKQGKEFKDAVNEKRAPKLMAETAWLFGLCLLTAAMAATMQKLLAGKDPESLKDLAFPQIDPKDASVRVSIPTYIKDAMHLWHSPAGYITSSSAGWIGRVTELWQNHNFYGVQIRNPDDSAIKQALGVGKHLGTTLMPFSISGYNRLAQQGANPAKRLLSFAGMNPAPGYISKSSAQQLASEINAARMPASPITEQQQERRIAKSQLVQQVRNGDRSGIAQALAAKTIQPSDVKLILKKAAMTPLQASVNTMSLDQVKKVSSVASPEEKRQLAPIIARKQASTAGRTAFQF